MFFIIFMISIIPIILILFSYSIYSYTAYMYLHVCTIVCSSHAMPSHINPQGSPARRATYANTRKPSHTKYKQIRIMDS